MKKNGGNQLCKRIVTSVVMLDGSGDGIIMDGNVITVTMCIIRF